VSLSDAQADVAINRALWTIVNSEFTDDHAYEAWAADEITWGLFQIPERDLGVLGDIEGLDVLELGCGTAYLSAWLARQGPGRSASTSPARSWPPRAAARSASIWCSP
jgi:2-polyprenyl-3-methyl-5-hydroxy-6-metoxy-1,4-benzoquinol methylase